MRLTIEDTIENGDEVTLRFVAERKFLSSATLPSINEAKAVAAKDGCFANVEVDITSPFLSLQNREYAFQFFWKCGRVPVGVAVTILIDALNNKFDSAWTFIDAETGRKGLSERKPQDLGILKFFEQFQGIIITVIILVVLLFAFNIFKEFKSVT